MSPLYSGHPGWSLSCLMLVFSFLTDAAKTTSALVSYPLVPHHVQMMRRGLSLQESTPSVRRRDIAQQVGALYQGYGTHYIDLWCGSPPQRQTVIVDTGSGVTAFPCNGCKDCGVPKYHIDQLFNEEQSSTFHANSCSEGCKTSRGRCNGGQCKLSMSYAEGSRWDAFEAIDRCYVGGLHEKPLAVDSGTENIDPNHASHFAFDMVFGCQTYLTGLFKTQLADGIMGMDSRDEAFWNQMFRAGKMGTSKQFALCFSRQPTAERKGTESGALTLGGVDERLHLSPMIFTTGADGGRSGFFSVRVRRILMRSGMAGESAKSIMSNPMDGITVLDIPQKSINSGGIIVDSGTTDTYWNRAIASVFKTAFMKLSGRTHSNSALSLTEAELHALPTILFQLETDPAANPGMNPFFVTGLAGILDPQNPTDIILAFPPSHYMEYDPDTGKYTSRFYVTESGGSVLGANAMMGHDVLFDADNSRIGWAESSCDYTNLVTTNGYDFSITGDLQPPPGGSGDISTSPPDTSGGMDIGDIATPVPETPAPEAPPTPAPQSLETPAPEAPPTPAPQLLETPAPEAPPTPAPQSLETPAPEAPPTLTPQALETPAPQASETPGGTPVAAGNDGGSVVTPSGDVSQPSGGKGGGTSVDGDSGDGEDRGAWGNIKHEGSVLAHDTKQGFDKFLEVCDTPECRYPVFIFLLLALCLGVCLSYCFSCSCCRRKPEYKYARASAGENEIEMADGRFSSYADEPDSSNGSFSDEPKSSIRFKDKPDRTTNGSRGKPEFQGDFI